MTVKLYFIPAGRCMLDHSSVNGTLAPGNLLNLPVWCYLLETEEVYFSRYRYARKCS